MTSPFDQVKTLSCWSRCVKRFEVGVGSRSGRSKSRKSRRFDGTKSSPDPKPSWCWKLVHAPALRLVTTSVTKYSVVPPELATVNVYSTLGGMPGPGSGGWKVANVMRLE